MGSPHQPWGPGLGQDPLGDSCPRPSAISIPIQGTTYGEPSTAGTRPTATSSPDPRPTSPSRTSTTQVGAALTGLQPPVPPQPCADPPLPSPQDCWLHVRLYYCDVLVKELTTRTAEGCRIASRAEPAESERLYGPSCMEQIEFPPPRALGGSSRVAGVTEVLERLLPHLERGVLLWVAPEGVFMKRQCQGRVYWNGPLAPHRDWPNKLEREKTYKLLDTQQFLQRKCPQPPATLGVTSSPPPGRWGQVPSPGTASGGCKWPVSCRAAEVPEPGAAGAAVPDPPVLRRGVPHQRQPPLPEAHHGPREYLRGWRSPKP